MSNFADRSIVEEESLRAANNWVRDLAVYEPEAPSRKRRRFLCECAEPACVETIELTLDEYDRIRDQAGVRAVAPGHGSGADVNGRNDRFWVATEAQSHMTDEPSADNLDAVLSDIRDQAADIRDALNEQMSAAMREAPSENG